MWCTFRNTLYNSFILNALHMRSNGFSWTIYFVVKWKVEVTLIRYLPPQSSFKNHMLKAEESTIRINKPRLMNSREERCDVCDSPAEKPKLCVDNNTSPESQHHSAVHARTLAPFKRGMMPDVAIIV